MMNTSQRILVVEDEPAIADTVLYALNTEGFDSQWADTAAAALQALAAAQFALVILDVGLPDMNGFDAFKCIAQQQPGIPVIFLTARNSEIDRVVGLELGADDYVAKPFSPRELVARVRTVLRRLARAEVAAAPLSSSSSLSSSSPKVTPASVQTLASSLVPAVTGFTTGSDFRVDDERKLIFWRGAALPLARYEYRLLKLLVERPGRVWSRDELMQQVWDDPAASFDRTVDAHVKTLRAKLRAIDPQADPILTHRGMGYALRER